MYNKLELNDTFRKYKNIIESNPKKDVTMPDVDYSSYPARISGVPNWESNAKKKIVENFEQLSTNLNSLNELNNNLKSQTDLVYGDLKTSLENLENLINEYNNNVDLYNSARSREELAASTSMDMSTKHPPIIPPKGRRDESIRMEVK